MAIATPASAQNGQRHDYNVAVGNLGDALRTVSRLSGREIIFSAEAVNGKNAPHLRGTYSADEAVRALLEGSDLTAEFRKDVILIRGRSEASGEVEGRLTDNGTDNDIVITGSHIRGAPSSSPVIVSDRQSIQDAGLTDLGGFARSLPQNFTGGQNPGVAGGGNQGTGNQNLTNSSALNLRGLGPDATLTLINGHRVAYDAIGQGVDISAIPLSAIERVEIVADGSSALYGSDAVGGVANVILRRDFAGLETSARLSTSTDGGNTQQQYNAVTGTRWTTGGFMVSADLSHFSDVRARDRSYTSSLDPTATLLPGQRQIGVVGAGHQRLSSTIEFELDAQFNDRTSVRELAFLPTSSAFTNGNVNEVAVRSYAVTPTLRIDLPGSWKGVVSATHGRSKSDIHSRRFSRGAESNRGQLIYDNRTNTIEINGEGPLFAAPGGIARLALGAGYRSSGLDVYVTSTVAGVTNVTSDFTGTRDAFFGYGELSLPLVGPANRVPMLTSLRFTAAVRYEKYPDVAELATPKLGLIYEPSDDITIRGSWGKSFKAQTLFQENQLREGYLFPSRFFASSGLPASATVMAVTGGNKALRPERATAWTTSVAIHPRFAKGLNIEGSYFSVRYNDRVAVPISGLFSALSNPIYRDLIVVNPSSQLINNVLATLPQGLSNQTGAPFDPANVTAFIDDSLRNTARQKIRGVDLSASYRREFGTSDRLNITASASYIESDRQLTSGQPTLQLAGTIFDPPHWRGRGGGTWERSNFAFSAFANYIGDTVDDRFQPNTRVGAFTSIDLTARVKTTGGGAFGGIQATLSLLNVFNEKPAIIRNSDPADPPYDSTNYSVAGRVVGLMLTKSW